MSDTPIYDQLIKEHAGKPISIWARLFGKRA